MGFWKDLSTSEPVQLLYKVQTSIRRRRNLDTKGAREVYVRDIPVEILACGRVGNVACP